MAQAASPLCAPVADPLSQTTRRSRPSRSPTSAVTAAPFTTRTPWLASSDSTREAISSSAASKSPGERFEAERFQGFRHLEADVPAADDRGLPGPLGLEVALERHRGLEIVDVEDAAQVEPRNFGLRRLGSGGDDQAVVVDLLGFGAPRRKHRDAPPGGRELGDLVAGRDLDVAAGPKQFRRIDSQGVSFAHLAGDEVRQPAGRIRNVRPLFVHQNLEFGIDTPRPARRAQARRHTTNHQQSFGNHKRLRTNPLPEVKK
jgi:hypothetical protein